MNTAELTLHLPESEALFLKGFAERYQMSVSDLFVYSAGHLRKVEQYEPHPDIKKFAGIIPQNLDVAAAYYEHIEDKHQ